MVKTFNKIESQTIFKPKLKAKICLLNLASGRGESEATHGAPGGRSLFEAPLQVVPRREHDIRGGRAPRTAFQVVDAEGVLSKHGADSRRHWRDEGRRVRSRALLQRLRGPAGHPDVCVQIKTKKVSYDYIWRIEISSRI